MTVFAVLTAGLFPIIHIGRPWFFYWLLPLPSQRELWPNFRSPLLWDVFAVTTYLTVSSVFFYIGLIPDIAAARDRDDGAVAEAGLHHPRARLARYGPGVEELHPRLPLPGRARDAAGALGALGGVVGLRGLHRARLAHDDLRPYFVAGAILSGVAMVVTIAVPIRKIFGSRRTSPTCTSTGWRSCSC
jgi:Ni/Fe-hydrogenase subunit HybB-like protein